VIQLPSGIAHSSPAIWGASAAAFDPYRFHPSTKDALDKDTRKMQKDGFFPFGGGKHLCPGRHLATMEVLGFIAGLCMSWDFEGSGPGGKIVLPEKRFQKLGTAVRKPVNDVSVKIRKREGWERTTIAFGHGMAGNDNL
jgi:cytochrome P450